MWALNNILNTGDLLQLRAETEGKIALFYFAGGMLQKNLKLELDLIKMLVGYLNQHNVKCFLVNGERSTFASELSDCIHFWTIDELPSPQTHRNLFYLSPAYLRGFWWFNQDGLRNHSNLLKKTFNPDKIPNEPAKKFFETLQREFVAKGKTTYEQQTTGEISIPENCIFIATQGPSTITDYPVHLSYDQLIPAIIKTKGNRPVWIKPHPRMRVSTIMRLAEFHDPKNGIFFGDCNLHELISKSSLVITRCSVVALEAMMHQVPAIVSAQVDFHHGVETIRSPEELAPAMERLGTRQFDYYKYLFWYFKRNLVEPQKFEPTIRNIAKKLENFLGA